MLSPSSAMLTSWIDPLEEKSVRTYHITIREEVKKKRRGYKRRGYKRREEKRREEVIREEKRREEKRSMYVCESGISCTYVR